ncbi:hypothetical protein IWW54_003856 [Coemansia sp. RSA 2705]|nr:hypothetical protein IWW54_003856 [Coemansia sp. RSA 2705]
MLSPDLPLTQVETAEWGDPAANWADYATIRSYAPYDNIRAMGTQKRAPSILVTAGGLDQRVSVWQPAKWVARLRDQGGYSGNPAAPKLLFLPRMSEGHFHSDNAKPGSGFADTHSVINAFLINEVTGEY